MTAERLGILCAIVFLMVDGALGFVRASDLVSAEQTRIVPISEGGGLAVQKGRSLFLKNCAHCHGDDARGDEGPDLHGFKQSDAWIEKRIRNGIKGEMPAFGEKFKAADVTALIAFLRSLN